MKVLQGHKSIAVLGWACGAGPVGSLEMSKKVVVNEPQPTTPPPLVSRALLTCEASHTQKRFVGARTRWPALLLPLSPGHGVQFLKGSAELLLLLLCRSLGTKVAPLGLQGS